MNEAAIRLLKEAVLRALLKNPGDVEFYRAQVMDPLKKPQYRHALQQAIEESRGALESRQQNGHRDSSRPAP